MILIFSSFARHFTDESNITNILTQVTINLIMATGMTFVILIGGIDLYRLAPSWHLRPWWLESC